MKKSQLQSGDTDAVGSFHYAVLSNCDSDWLHLCKSSSGFSDSFGIQITSGCKILNRNYEGVGYFFIILNTPPSIKLKPNFPASRVEARKLITEVIAGIPLVSVVAH